MSLKNSESVNLYEDGYVGSFCRLCANKSESPLISIFCGGSKNFAMKLMFYLPIKVTETDSMPLEICMTCLDSILRWDDFYQSFIDADRKLKLKCFSAVKEEPQNLDHSDSAIYGDYESYEQEEYYSEQGSRPENSTSNFLNTSEPLQGYCNRNFMKRNDDEDLLKVMKMVDEQGRESDQGELAIAGSDEYYSQTDLLEPIRFRNSIKILRTCNICHITHPTDEKAAIHMLEKHDKHQYLQYLLRLQLNQVDELTISMESKIGTGSYQCKHCGRIFASPSKLSVHLRTHTGKRPFHCFLCTKTFRQTCHAITHMKLTHFNIRKFQCKVCRKLFYSRSKFRFHLTKHKGGGKF